jgi:hypothetical protein
LSYILYGLKNCPTRSQPIPSVSHASSDGQWFAMLRPTLDESAEQPVLVVAQNWFAEFEQE